MLKNIKAVIFDLDGSLVDSMWLWKEIDIEYLGRFGHTLPESLQTEIEGMNFHETAVYIKNRFQIPDSLEEMQDEWNRMAFEKYAHEVHLKAGALDFLKECRKREIRLGIASSNSRELIETCLTSNQVKDYFGCIMSGTDGLKGKPAPDIYLAAAGKLGVDPGHCLVFEDIVAGIQAGKNAGMRVCAVEDLYSRNQEAAKIAQADYFIRDFCHLWNETVSNDNI